MVNMDLLLNWVPLAIAPKTIRGVPVNRLSNYVITYLLTCPPPLLSPHSN